MAMSAALLGALQPVRIADAAVVSKSFPYFWQQLGAVGLTISEFTSIDTTT
jgi:5-enolpyruvylshikimate-3-phosphate synthase